MTWSFFQPFMILLCPHNTKVPMYTLSLQRVPHLRVTKTTQSKLSPRVRIIQSRGPQPFGWILWKSRKQHPLKSILCLVNSKKTQAIRIHEVANKDSYLNVQGFSSFKMTQFLHGQCVCGGGGFRTVPVPHIYCILYPYYYYIASLPFMKHQIPEVGDP